MTSKWKYRISVRAVILSFGRIVVDNRYDPQPGLFSLEVKMSEDLDEAIADFNHAVRLDPDSVQAFETWDQPKQEAVTSRERSLTTITPFN